MISDAELQQLTSQERVELLARLVEVDRLPTLTDGGRRYRRYFVRTLMLAALVLIPWIVYVAVKLPHRYRAHNWDIAWALFDIALLIALGITAWAAWKRRQILIVSSLVAGTLLVVDAWFDMITSAGGRDHVYSVLSGLLIELPLAVLLFSAAYRVLRMTARTFDVVMGGTGEVGSVWKLPMFAQQAHQLTKHARSRHNADEQ